MAGCKVDLTRSPEFRRLQERLRRTYPNIEKDLADAFKAITSNISACGGVRVQAGVGLEVYKYRHNSRDIKRGARYGWRIVAVYDKVYGYLYPILVWAKPELSDVSDVTVSNAIRELRTALGHCTIAGCDGKMQNIEPMEKHPEDGSVRVACDKCGTLAWRIGA